jgi:hypothetical protein
MPAILQLVSAVGSTTALLDLNDNPSGIMVGRPEGGPTALGLAAVDLGDTASMVWTPTGAAATPEATTRTISVPVVLFGATTDALGTKVQTLMKLLGQPWVLRVRRSGATTDGWIRCYPTIPQLQTNITGNHAGVTVQGTIVATTEPYAYGARVDKSAVTVPLVNNTTASAFLLDVTSVTGDAPTPAVIRCTDTTLTGAAHGTLFAVRRSGTPTNLTGYATAATAGAATVTGTTTTSNLSADGGLAGGTGVRFSFAATASGYGRLIYTPSITGAEAPGLYKLLARARRSSTVEYLINVTVAGYKLDGVTYAATGTNTRMLDLGIVQLPAGQPQQLAAPTAAVIGAEPPQIVIDVTRTTGTAATTFDWDYFLLVPCDEDAGAVYQSLGASVGQYLTLDGYAQDAFLTTGDPFNSSSAGASNSIRCDYVGGVPRLYPGLTNRLFIVGGFSSVTVAPLSQSAAFSLSFWPRYTWLP